MSPIPDETALVGSQLVQYGDSRVMELGVFSWELGAWLEMTMMGFWVDIRGSLIGMLGDLD